MTTKNIKKILLNKDGNKFVVDTENIVRSVNGVNADENGNVEIPKVDLSGLVKSVNNIQPNENGNVQLGSIVKSVNSIAPDERGNVLLEGLVKSVNDINADENGNISLISEDATTTSDAITIDDNSSNNISLTTASEITVANGIVGKAWSKSVKITNSDSTITLGSSWTWVNGEVPTLSANSLLVLKWCYDYGVAGLVKITG